MRIGQHGVEAEPFGAGREGILARRGWKHAHAEIHGRLGPLVRIERAGAHCLCLPCEREAFGVDVDEAERRAGLLRAAIHRVVREKRPAETAAAVMAPKRSP
jgi:hypothetical protein